MYHRFLYTSILCLPFATHASTHVFRSKSLHYEYKPHMVLDYSQEHPKELFTLTYSDKKATHPINYNHWASTGTFQKNEKEIYYGTLQINSYEFSLNKSFTTINDYSKQCYGPF